MPALKKNNTEAAEETKVVAKTKAPKKVAAPKAAKKATKSEVAPGSRPAWALSTLGTPIFTEKTAHMSAHDVYVFRVAKDVNRITVKQAFNAIYGVMPKKVNILISHGKEKRTGRVISRRSDLKRAIITVPKGVKIDVV